MTVNKIIDMKSIRYYIAKIQSKVTRSERPILDFYRRRGIKVGDNCLICSYLMTKEPYLLEIGNNVIVSTNVSFITHDRSPKNYNGWGDLFGRIKVGDNCFIGENAIILYGVELGKNTLVAAGSVVTKSFLEGGVVIGGNPAKVIGKWEDMNIKYKDNIIHRKDMKARIGVDESFLVRK